MGKPLDGADELTLEWADELTLEWADELTLEWADELTLDWYDHTLPRISTASPTRSMRGTPAAGRVLTASR